MSTKVKINKARLSYAHLFEKAGFEGSTPKYSCDLLIPKSDTETIEELQKAYKEAVQAGFDKYGKDGFAKGEKNAPFVRGDKSYGLLKDGDDNDAPGFWILPAKTSEAPGVLAMETGRTRLTKENGGPEIVYSGCWVKATVNVYPFGNPKPGISCSLNNVLKVEDGEKFGGIARAEDDFDDELKAIEDNLADLI